VKIGYDRTEVADAIARQVHKLAYYHSYAAHTADELAILGLADGLAARGLKVDAVTVWNLLRREGKRFKNGTWD
jgi:adenosylmethionine-8-amino-7-oxononanoate aminotransferase